MRVRGLRHPDGNWMFRNLNLQPILLQSEAITIYAVIFVGRKFCRFRCKLIVRKILILEKKQWLKGNIVFNLIISEN